MSKKNQKRQASQSNQMDAQMAQMAQMMKGMGMDMDMKDGQLPINNILNIAKQMTKNVDKSNVDLNSINNMVDQFTNMLGSQFDQNTQTQLKNLTKGALNSIVKDEPMPEDLIKDFEKQMALEEQNSKNSKNSHKTSKVILPGEEEIEQIENNEQIKEHHYHEKLAVEPSHDPRIEHKMHHDHDHDQDHDGNKYVVPSKKDNYESLDDDELADHFQPRTKDMIINLDVSMEELYNGREKKIAIKRERIRNGEIVNERKKIIVSIEPGMKDEQVIRYNKQASEKFGYDTGDIVIVLKQNGHPVYERVNDNLFVCKNISLFESYAAAIGQISLVIVGLDGRILKLNAKGLPLHENNGHRKIVGFGMPINHRHDDDDKEGHKHDHDCNKTHGDLYLRFNLMLPKELDVRVINGLKNYFPSINKDSIVENEEHEHDPESIVSVNLDELTEEDIKKLNEEEDEYSEEYSDDDESEYSYD